MVRALRICVNALSMMTVLEYGDARDRVTELICAEMSALSSLGNMISFAEESFQLFRNYASKHLEFEEYEKKY